jgi:hypothetical protein
MKDSTMKDSTFERYCLVVDWWVVNSFNGTKAWQEFYPDTSDEVAAASFVRMLRIDKVAKYKADKMKAASEVLGTSHLEILTELKNWLYSDITELIDLTVDDIKLLPIEVRRLVTEFEKTTTTFEGKETVKIKLKFVSKEKAMDVVTKHIAFFEDHNKQKSGSTTPEQRAADIAAIEAIMKGK